MRKSTIFMVAAFGSFMLGRPAFCLEPVHLALASRSFQYTIFPLAQERGYMKEEGIDLRIVQMQTTPGMQKPLAARMYDDLLNSFTGNGAVDEETQRNDLAIVAQVAGMSDPIAPARAYDFSNAL
jgi:ABC-type nitrate/sulfonate/bicarbonate transport system substrate-binding protein